MQILKKVLMLVDGLDITNGVSITCKELAKNWAKANSEWELYIYGSTIISLSNLTYPKANIKSNKGLIRLPVLGYTGMWLSLPIVSLFYIFSLTRYQVIHVATPGPLGILGVFVARILKKTLITTHHTRMVDYLDYYVQPSLLPFIKSMAKILFRYLYAYSKVTIVHSPPAGEEAKELGAPNVLYIPMGVEIPYPDMEKLSPEKRRAKNRIYKMFNLPDGTPIILYVGRFSKEKNILHLAEVSRKLKYSFIFVGGGPLKESLARYSNITIAGFRYGDELKDLYLSADLFVSASISETLGKIFLEALAHGTPVLVPDKGHHNAVLSDESQAIYKYHCGTMKQEIQEISHKIMEVINMDNSNGIINKAALSYALKFSWDRVILQHLAPYQELPESSG